MPALRGWGKKGSASHSICLQAAPNTVPALLRSRTPKGQRHPRTHGLKRHLGTQRPRLRLRQEAGAAAGIYLSGEPELPVAAPPALRFPPVPLPRLKSEPASGAAARALCTRPGGGRAPAPSQPAAGRRHLSSATQAEPLGAGAVRPGPARGALR